MKQIIFTIFIIACSSPAFSQIQLRSTNTSSEYGIDIPFQIANYDVIDTVLPGIYGVSQIFSTIIMEDESYGIVDSLGFPLLPRFVADLQVPVNSSQYTVSITLPKIDSFYVSYPLMPALDDIRKDSAVYIFNMDTLYYGSNNCFVNIGASVFEEYKVFGEKGIAVSVIPFEYCPNEGLVRFLISGTLHISFSLDSPLMTRDTLTHRRTKVVEEHLSNLFCNYETRQVEETSENYLIITAPQFENTISYFADYKRRTGFNVTVVNTNTTGTTANSIISYLKNKYNNLSTRPEYVLLVGSSSLIPVSAGTSSNINDPVTDLFYALLDGNDFVADVFLGRMPVTTSQQLQNVINKTIFMETNLRGMSKKATFIAGQENNSYMENLFEQGHDYVIPNSFQPKGYQCTKLYQPDFWQVQGNLSSNPLYYIYSGHGSETYWGAFNANLINMSYNTVCPFAFAFACKTGNFVYTGNIATSWLLKENKGSVTYFGASVRTYCHSDYIIEKNIFGSGFSENKSISSIINSGMLRYKNYFWATIHIVRTIRYLKAYNLLGDPSLIVGGKRCLNSLCFYNNQHYYSGEFTEYHVASTISHDYNFIVDDGASIHLQAGGEIVLTSGFYSANGSDFIAKIEACSPDDYGLNGLEDDAIGERGLRGDASRRDDVHIVSTNATATTDGLRLHPNPANTTLTVESDSPVRAITIYDLTGRTMLTVENCPSPATVNVVSLPRGIYLLRAVTEEGVKTARFVKN